MDKAIDGLRPLSVEQLAAHAFDPVAKRCFCGYWVMDVSEWAAHVLSGSIPLRAATEPNAEGTCGLFHCPLSEAIRLLPALPWDSAPIWEGVEYVVDVKVHKLMPKQWPCIPNWHCDFVPRDEETLVERPELITDGGPPMMFWISGPPITEFKDGRTVTPGEWMEFTQRDYHRGIAATEHGWRTFIRLAPADLVRAGLPREEIPAPPDQWIRRHAQVYLDAGSYKW